MRFNVLVVAAMVITSVNAVRRGRFTGRLGSNSMPRSDSEQNLLGDGSEPELTQDPPEHKPELVFPQNPPAHVSIPGPSQDSQGHGLAPVVPDSLIEDGSKSVVSENLLGDGLESGSSQDSPGHVSRPGPSQDPPRHRPGASQVSKPRQKDPVCDPIVKKLNRLWLKADEIDARFYSLMPVYYRLMKGEDMKGKRIKKHKLKLKQMIAYLALSNEHKAILGEFKVEYAGVAKEYPAIWTELMAKECWTEFFHKLPLEKMIKKGYFLQL
ncbi:hypothetical protein BASA50_007934 [Batrachochytrium salamandrivorans]|uniref:Uncharacterized protein n=1 Tax=Batrachochytrium salamandrivorans TaxID=1357716 RepID=A0ABQ8F6S3_9FUNG|nr:hypothetical protein BASA62_003259 [Batrachochytrium salamandrivorans]KAH6577554.1 hypothetical protein BASA60_003960 [Batrachochytrium salamandrivorans]KAH6578969.1 hypothetical protein BASA61_010565 [Batrachochytrium salamandrivorans]KAH6592646.1 hypothetical protein BASA50_007934 [Batrachochytrium salamandrivorans]KAH9247575.1 hypothetical protein BASA81_014831 [Batrachochytrium salamandrivorans]